MKDFFINSNGEVHFGNMSPEGFFKVEKSEAVKILENPGNKKLWRCNVCNDLHISVNPLKQCPTCKVIEAYVEINKQEFLEMIK